MKSILTRLSLGLGIMMTTAFAQMNQPGITVTGVGNAYGTPDVAIIDMGIEIANEDITAATDDVFAVTNKLLELFKRVGIETKDVRTAYFNVWREVRYDSEGKETTPVFRVTNTLSVTVRDVTKVGTLLNESLTAGANTINGIQYTIANPEELEQEARSLAMQNAKARAAELAILSGVTLGKVLSVSETPGYVGTPLPFVAGQELGRSAALPVTPGQLAVSVNITVTFEIIEP